METEMLWRRALTDKAHSSHSNRSSIITPWWGNFSSSPRYSCISGACLASSCLGSPPLDKCWLPTQYSSSCVKCGCHTDDARIFPPGRFSGSGSRAALHVGQSRGVAVPGAGLQSQRSTRALLSSSPSSPDSVRCTALPYTAPAPRTNPVITAEPTSFRGCGEGTEGGHQHHPHLTCVLSPQTKVKHSVWPHQNPTRGIPAPHLALPTSEPAALPLISAHICLWNRLSLIPLARVLLPGQCLKSLLVAGRFLMVFNGMHTCGCCDANRVAMVLILPIISVPLAGLTIHLQLAQLHQNLME